MSFDQDVVRELAAVQREIERLKTGEQPGSGVTDHGALTGLGDNDHPQYSLTTHNHDHGALTGLGDDDHTQYYNQARGDARYSLTSHTHASVAYATSAGNADTVDGYHAQGFINLMNEIGEGILMYRGSNQTPAQSQIVRVDINAALWNSLGGTLSGGVYYVPETGWYYLYGGIGWNGGANGNTRNTYLRAKGNHYMAVQGNSNSGVNDYHSLSCVAYLAANDPVELLVWTNAASAFIQAANYYSPVLGVVRLTRPW